MADQLITVVTNHQKGGSITIGVITADGYDGTWGIQASPDGINWLDVESLKDQVASVIVALPYLPPYFRFKATAGTVGSCTFYAFGPGVQDIQ